MEKRIWKIAWFLGGIVLTLGLALAAGLLTLPPDSGDASKIGSAEATVNSVEQPSETITRTIPQYPVLPHADVAVVTQDWPTYVNETYGFQIRYPAHFYTTTWVVSGTRAMYVSFIDRKWKGQSEVPDIGIVIYNNPEKLPLRTWLMTHTGDPANPETTENVLFVDPGKIEEVRTAGATALKFVDGGMFPMPSLLMDQGKYAMKVYYTPIGPDNLEPVYELMLATLEFKPTN